MSDFIADYKYYILLHEKLGKKKDKGLVSRSLGSGSSKVQVLQGTLLETAEPSRNRGSKPGNTLELRSLEPENVWVDALPTDVKVISQDEYDLLVAIPTCKDRLHIFENKEWLREGLDLDINHLVKVDVRGYSDPLIGTIRSKGLIPEVKGTYFGIELQFNPGAGTSNGIHRRQRYFKCKNDSAVFCGLHRIRRYIPPRKQGSLQSHDATADKCGENLYGLKIGDRVVWVSDLGPVNGTVKWIGFLPYQKNRRPERKDDVTVGVDFDEPVGTGTGKYQDYRLFTAKQNHASLVPIIGLIKYEEYYGKPDEASGHSSDNSEAEFQKLDLGDPVLIRSQEEILQQLGHRSEPDHIRGSGASVSHEDEPMTLKKRGNMSENRWEGGLSDHEVVDSPHPNVGEDQEMSSKLLGRQLTKSASDADPDIEVGSMVEVLGNPPMYGVVKWIGFVKEQSKPIAGLEMEEEISAGTDGTFMKQRLFTCPERKAFFVPLMKCRTDKRFIDGSRLSNTSEYFGSIDCPDVDGDVSPPTSLPLEKFQMIICGKSRGIQGHHNSCYLDATLFSMFYFTVVFDSIFYRPRRPDDLPEYEEVQTLLKDGIVNPLRKNHYVRADKVMKLRSYLDKLGNVAGMLNEEKDPEEFLMTLFQQIMKVDPFIHLSSGQHTYLYQLFMEKDDKLTSPTVQQLFDASFLLNDIKLSQTPACLILQTPRFGKEYKMYDRIIPSLELDITDVLENDPRECVVCGRLASIECRECYQHLHQDGLVSTAYCEECSSKSHQHKNRIGHKPKSLKALTDFKKYYQNGGRYGASSLPREKMELFAVVCIETSHYVSFVKCGEGLTAPWVFFDSMADRKGLQSGYNIPEVSHCPELSQNILEKTRDFHEDKKDLPVRLRRILCDSYMYMYQNTDVMKFQ